jgi:hypothetical protein
VCGFASGETDFATRFARLAAVDVAYLTALVARIAGGNFSGESVVAISTIGYSDRVDQVGLSHAECLRQEAEASAARAASASTWLRDQLITAFAGTSYEGVDSTEWRGISAMHCGAGATDLMVPSPANDDDRLNNRRVRFLINTWNTVGFVAGPEEVTLGVAPAAPA